LGKNSTVDIQVILNENDFALGGTYYERDEWNGRCYFVDTHRAAYLPGPQGKEASFVAASAQNGLANFTKNVKQKSPNTRLGVAKVFEGAA
jgi:hypothetical protein